MRKTTSLTIACALVISGCAMERTAGKVATDHRACVTNYSTSGNFWGGKKFKTYEDFPNVAKDAAFDSVIASIASNGFQIITSSKESGFVSANQTVTGGNGKTVPLNAVITHPGGNGSRVELVFSLSGGLAISADTLQSKFCEILASVNQNVVDNKKAPEPEVAPPPAPTKKKSVTRKKKKK